MTRSNTSLLPSMSVIMFTTLLLAQAAYFVGLAATSVSVVVVLEMVVLTAFAVDCGMITVVGSPVSIMIKVVLTVVSTRQSTRCGCTLFKFEPWPLRSMMKPPEQVEHVCLFSG